MNDDILELVRGLVWFLLIGGGIGAIVYELQRRNEEVSELTRRVHDGEWIRSDYTVDPREHR